MTKLGKLQFNTSAARDDAIKLVGAENYYRKSRQAWNEWLQVSHEIMPDIEVTFGRGVSGPEGVEDGWKRLCEGSVGAQEGLVYLM